MAVYTTLELDWKPFFVRMTIRTSDRVQCVTKDMPVQAKTSLFVVELPQSFGQ